MFKLVKYEFRRTMLKPLIALGIALLLELYMAFQLAIGATNNASATFALQVVLICVSYFAVMGLSMSSYSKDLTEKSGYMTFMVPLSTYKVIGAKLLNSFMQSSVFLGLLLVFMPVNLSLLEENFDESALIFFEVMGYAIHGAMGEIIVGFIKGIVMFFLIVIVAYYSITATSTTSKSKGVNGVLAFFVCILLFIFLGIFSEVISSITEQGTVSELVANVIEIIFYLVCIVIGFVVTASSLEKKFNL